MTDVTIYRKCLIIFRQHPKLPGSYEICTQINGREEYLDWANTLQEAKRKINRYHEKSTAV